MRRKPIRKRAAGGRSGMNNNTPKRMGKARPLLVPAPPSMAPTKNRARVRADEIPVGPGTPPKPRPGPPRPPHLESAGVDMNQIYAEYCGTEGSEDDPCCVYFGTPRFDPRLCHNLPKMSTYNRGGGTNNTVRRTTPVLAKSVEDNNQLFAPTCSGPGAENNPCCKNWGTQRFNPGRACWDDRAYTLKKGGRTKPAVRRNRRKAVGGSMGIPSSCPPGTHMMPDGSCMQGAYHGAPNGGGYRKGGRTNIKNRARGGSMHVGGNTACRMHTGKYDCVSPCKWDFNDGVCH